MYFLSVNGRSGKWGWEGEDRLGNKENPFCTFFSSRLFYDLKIENNLLNFSNLFIRKKIIIKAR